MTSIAYPVDPWTIASVVCLALSLVAAAVVQIRR